MNIPTDPQAAIKFVWAYLIENGDETDGGWSYYGGRFEQPHPYDANKQLAARKIVKDKIKYVGVDWTKTLIPKSGTETSFEGTFHPASITETLIGEMFFLDGISIMLGASGVDHRFSVYIESLAKFMEDKNLVKDIFGE